LRQRQEQTSFDSSQKKGQKAFFSKKGIKHKEP
jgi:hypothetical protein